MKLFSTLFDSTTQGATHRVQPTLNQINALENEIQLLTNSQLTDRFLGLRREIQSKNVHAIKPSSENKKSIAATLDSYLPEAFALTREASLRTLGMRHYDVQLTGGIILHQGKIAEMKTGEGKTLVATLPLALNATLGYGAHLVTVNDYLAKRDAGWNGPVYHMLGLSVAFIGHEQSYIYDPTVTLENEADSRLQHFRSVTRQEAYLADITYGTNNEFGFDYLRDHMEGSPSRLRQRPFWFAIVDEVDSILIDEARTPLIISGPASQSTSLYATFAQIVPRLRSGEDYSVNEKDRAVAIGDAGIAKVEEALGLAHLYSSEHIILVHHLEEALKAHALFKKNKDYVVKDGEVVIVDEFTGRMMPGRRYSEGLHQAIEAKEKVEVQRESETLATISFQNLFRLYPKLAGMTGTAFTESEEFWKIYGLEVLVVPTNRENIRIDRQDLIFKSEAGKLDAVIADIEKQQKNGRPILVGSISVAKSERLSRLLKKAGIEHQVLNAKYHEREAKVIQNAGLPGTVTVATNMAGRGVDIVLGGVGPENDVKSEAPNLKMTQWEENHRKVLEAGGLLVIGTERHESRRIDNQLRGRSARQGDPGETVFYVSMEDDLMRIFGGDRMKAMMNRLGLPEDQPITHRLITRSIESSQKRVEGHNFDIRKHLVEYDDVMNKHREVLYRKRQRILDLILPPLPGKNEMDHGAWLHNELVELMTDDEGKAYAHKTKEVGLSLIKQAERIIYLQTIDAYWREHLTQMEELRTGIGLQGYAQTDPLVAYKREAYTLFERLLVAIDTDVVSNILRMEIASEPPKVEQAPPQNLQFHGADESLAGGAVLNQNQKLEDNEQSPSLSSSEKDSRGVGPLNPNAGHIGGVEPKVGRNEPCPCGSGKKFKKCHGK